MKNINIFKLNHGSSEGIEELLSVLHGLFEDCNVVVSSELKYGWINVVIDEFTGDWVNSYIKKFSEKNDSPLVLYATEFIETEFPVSFNVFTKSDKIMSEGLAAFYLWLFKGHTEFSISSLILSLPISIYKLRKGFRRFFKYFFQKVYMLERFHGFDDIKYHFTHVITAHQEIENQLIAFGLSNVCGTPLPIVHVDEDFRTKFLDNRLGIMMSGSITEYRKRVAAKLENDFWKCGLIKNTGLVKKKNFGVDQFESVLFTLHPAQTKEWKYVSPTRIYRSLVVDHSYPILEKKYNQSALEDLCFVLSEDVIDTIMEIEMDRVSAFDNLVEKINRYNDIAQRENKTILYRVLRSEFI